MRLDGFVAVLPLLLALAGMDVSTRRAWTDENGGTDSLTTMNGRPCSSFITAAAAHARVSKAVSHIVAHQCIPFERSRSVYRYVSSPTLNCGGWVMPADILNAILD
jgi:hypothetical protein